MPKDSVKLYRLYFLTNNFSKRASNVGKKLFKIFLSMSLVTDVKFLVLHAIMKIVVPPHDPDPMINPSARAA